MVPGLLIGNFETHRFDVEFLCPLQVFEVEFNTDESRLNPLHKILSGSEYSAAAPSKNPHRSGRAEKVWGSEAYMLWAVRSQNGNSGQEKTMKFLVLWHFDLTRLGPEVARAVMQMPDYAKKLGDKLECRYHVIGSHGGAWIYKVTSNEELDRLLAMSPVYNYATYQVLALAEMLDPMTTTGNAS
jgi:muconolactone D-isomerase